MTEFLIEVAWDVALILLFVFAVVFSARLDWRHYPTLGVVAFLLLLAPTLDGVLGLPPMNPVTLLLLLFAAGVFAAWYLVRQVIKPPTEHPLRRSADVFELGSGDMTRTIRSVERRAA